MNKKLLIVPLLLGVHSVASDDIYISENFINHFCKNIDKVSVASTSGTKEELFELLKVKARKLGANSIIQAEYGGGFYGTQNIASGIAADCDISKSPNFFLKSNGSAQIKNVFGLISVSSENVTMESSSSKEIKSSAGVNGKIGILNANFRYYGTFNYGLGMTILASADYIFKPIQQTMSFFAGVSAGASQYDLSSGKSISTKISGLQVGVRYLNFEFGIQKLFATDATKVDNIEYKPNDISIVSIGYYF